MSKRSTLGVDFGGVINDGSSHPSGDDTTFLTGGYEAAMQTPAMVGAVDALGRLTKAFKGRVFVVSKCGPRIQARTEQWLRYHRFFEGTGIDPSHLRFCRRRPEKAGICADLGITHFVDDRVDVLHHMVGVVDHRFLFGAGDRSNLGVALGVRGWSEAEAAIVATIARSSAGLWS